MGAANITATSSNSTGPVSGYTTLTVGAAELRSIAVTPVSPTITFVSGAPPTLQFTATGIKTDGSTDDNTTDATWSSLTEATATIDAATGLATTVAAGTTTITATLDGKTDSSTLTVLADTVAPVVTLSRPSEGLIIRSTSLTVTGNVSDTTAYTRTNTDVIVNEISSALTVDVNGNFSQVVTLNAGSNTVLVRAVDESGNTGMSGTRTVVVDPDKPDITITSPVEGLPTNNDALTVTGNLTYATSATLRLNGRLLSVTMTGGNFTATGTLAEGKNVIVASAYATGHEGDADWLGTSGVRTVTLDTTAPVATIISPASDSMVSTPGIEVSGTVDDPDVTTAQLTLNGASQSIPVASGNFSQKVTLTQETNTITVAAADEAGNASTTSATIIYDNTVPQVTLTTPVNELLTNVAAQLVTGNVTDPSITTATLTLNEGTSSQVVHTIGIAPDGSFSKMLILTAVANTIEVRATDAADNTGTSGVVNVRLDTTAPVVTIGLSDPTDSIIITVSSNEALRAPPTVAVGSANVTMTQSGVDRWTGTFEPIPDGRYTVTATGTDVAGNLGTTTATFCKETVDIDAGVTKTVQTETTTVEIDTTANLTDQSISVTQHMGNPAENAESEIEAGVFVEIIASPELRDSIDSIYIEVKYVEADLDPRIEESSLRLYLWKVTIGKWELVPDSGVNTTGDYIWGRVTSLSKYGGFGTAPSVPTTTEPVVREREEDDGGGPAAIARVSTPGLSSVTPLRVDRYGKVRADCLLITVDQQASLDIALGTKLLNVQGRALSTLSAEVVTEPAAAPAGTVIVSAYDFGPDGATFSPAMITLTIIYDAESLPDGVSEEELYIAYWDGTQWVAVESTVDTEANTVSAELSHFTQFAVIGTVPPPVVPPVEEPVVPPVEEPVAPPVEEPVAPPVEEPVVPPVEEPVEEVPVEEVPSPVAWWVWLIVGIVVIAVIGVVIWLVLRRRTA